MRGKVKYKIGDTIEITEEMISKLQEEHGDWCRDWKAWLGRKGTVCSKRLDRSSGQTVIYWGDNETTNTYWLQDIGLEFEEAVFPELPIDECPEEFLTEKELIIKTMMSWGQREDQATEKVEEIMGAMAKHHIVFYIP